MPSRIYINGRFLQQPVTGVQRYARELLKTWDDLLTSGELDSPAPEFQVLAPHGPIDPPYLRQIPIRQVGYLNGHLWDQLELPFRARDGLLFSPSNVQPFLAPFLCPTVVTIHDLAYRTNPEAYTPVFRAVYRVLIPAALRRAAAVITVSNAEKDSIIEYFPGVRDRIHAIHHGGPDVKPLIRRPINDRSLDATTRHCARRPENFALWVGTLNKRKNPQGAIDAIALVNRKIKLPLVMVGATYRGFNDAGLTEPRGADAIVQYADRVDNAELTQLYRSATCLLFPSFNEGFGLPALEAMAHGCPVVASTIPALREVCGDAALYCDPSDPHDIAEKLTAIAEDSQLQNRLRLLGLTRAREFSWKKCALETFSIIRDSIAQRESHAHSRNGHKAATSA